MLPGLSGIHRLVHPVAFVDATTRYQIACADVDDAGIRRCDFDRPDRRDFLDRIEDREPGGSSTRGLPSATERKPDIKHTRLSYYPANSGNSSAAKWSNVAPHQSREEVGFYGTRSAEREHRD